MKHSQMAQNDSKDYYDLLIAQVRITEAFVALRMTHIFVWQPSLLPKLLARIMDFGH